MPSIVVIGVGVFLSIVFGWALLHPQRTYEIRQRGQTNDPPQLSPAGKLKWRALDAVFIFLGIAIVWVGLTM